MFGLGMTEILVILALALVLIGPKKLPDMARTLGKAMGEFKRSAQDFKDSIDLDSPLPDISDIDSSESSSLKEAVEAAKKEAQAEETSSPDLDAYAETENSEPVDTEPEKKPADSSTDPA